MKDYSVFYKEIRNQFKYYKKEIYYFNVGLTLLYYVLYPLLLILSFHKDYFMKLLLFPAISFVLLTVIRQFINRARPYEKWDIRPLIKKNTKGNSMPSRHIFSATMISMCYLMVVPVLGSILLAISAVCAFIRVIAGLHYPSDVIVGYLVGVVVGIFMIL